MHVVVPALKGRMGSRTYFAIVVPLKAIPQFFRFVNWNGFAPEDREQRVLNKTRIPAIADYIMDNRDDFILSSVVASYRAEPQFVPLPGFLGDDEEGTVGHLHLSLGDEFVVNDGQHRCAAVAAAMARDPDSLPDSTLSVLLFPHEGRDRVRQMFSDLNRNVARTSRSLDILYDRRDPAASVTTDVIERVPLFRDYTDLEATTLPLKSVKLFTLSSLYDANRDMQGDVEATNAAALRDGLVGFWERTAAEMRPWCEVALGERTAPEVRTSTVATSGIVLRALGGVGADILRLRDGSKHLEALRDINWSRTNPEWRGVCVMGDGSVLNNRQSRLAMASWLRRRLNLIGSETSLDQAA